MLFVLLLAVSVGTPLAMNNNTSDFENHGLNLAALCQHVCPALLETEEVQKCSKCHKKASGKEKVKICVNRRKCNTCIYAQRKTTQIGEKKFCEKCRVEKPCSKFTPGKKACIACCYIQNKMRNQHQRVCVKCDEKKPAAKFHPYARTCDKCCTRQQKEKLKQQIRGNQNSKTVTIFYPPFTVIRKLETHENNYEELVNVNKNRKRKRNQSDETEE
jgi:hypothetical protein